MSLFADDYNRGMPRTLSRISIVVALIAASLLPVGAAAVALRAMAAEDKPLFTQTFTPGEFKSRRVKVMQAIGDGVAILARVDATLARLEQP